MRVAWLFLTLLGCGGRTIGDSDVATSGGSVGSSDGGRSGGGKSGKGGRSGEGGSVGSSGAPSFGGAPALGGAPTSGGATGTGGVVDDDSPAVTQACLATCKVMSVCREAFTGGLTDCAAACRARARGKSQQCVEDVYVPFLGCAMDAFVAMSCTEASRRLLANCSPDAARAQACGLDLPYAEECVSATVMLAAESCYRSSICNNARFEVTCSPATSSMLGRCDCYVSGDYAGGRINPNPASDPCSDARTTLCGPIL